MKLEVKDLKINISENEIIKRVSIDVNSGDFVGILGPNGSGKSTLLRAIYRIQKFSSGAIFLNDLEIEKYKSKQLAKQMAVVGQFNNISFDLTVEEIVMMGRTPHLEVFERESQTDMDIVYDSLQKVGMLKFKNRKYDSLSGGEKQRIVLARALTQKPSLLILDEPTNHLDITYQLQILGIIKDLGINVLAALHDLSLASSYCDKVYILNEGEVDSVGAPTEVITREMIRRIYNVDCEILKNGDSLFIRYFPLI